jgi:hypothetical protein
MPAGNVTLTGVANSATPDPDPANNSVTVVIVVGALSPGPVFPVPVPPAEIPTLSEWGAITLALLLASLGWRRLQERRG